MPSGIGTVPINHQPAHGHALSHAHAHAHHEGHGKSSDGRECKCIKRL